MSDHSKRDFSPMQTAIRVQFSSVSRPPLPSEATWLSARLRQNIRKLSSCFNLVSERAAILVRSGDYQSYKRFAMPGASSQAR
jgi:hypothetical protein